MNELIKKIKEAEMIYICGNGGSAATADHFATDLIKLRYPAVSLCSNTSVLTMIGNDFGFEDLFSFQLVGLPTSGALLITISCSGTSPNIIKALFFAKWLRMDTYSFETFETFKKGKDYGKLEDEHLKFIHKLIKKL